jgi:uncharacterized protein with NAD-binding domain and iron-sulfur cluster
MTWWWVVGGGVAGLAAAEELTEAGLQVQFKVPKFAAR